MKYAKTEEGQQVIRTRSQPLSPRQRTLLLLCDGTRAMAEILETTRGMGTQPADVDTLVSLGLIVPASPTAPSATTAAGTRAPDMQAPDTQTGEAPPVGDKAQRYRESYQLATQLTSGLGLKGFRLQLAVESAMTLEDLDKLLPRLSEALLSTHGPKLGREKIAALQQTLRAG